MAISFNTDLPTELVEQIRTWGRELGFQAVGITDIDLSVAERDFLDWLEAGFHGDMEYMARHGTRRSRPAEMVEGTCRVISARMDYRPSGADNANAVLADSHRGYISRYALGRDYHKLMRKRLAKLAKRIEAVAGPFGYRVFVDSAPVLEKPLAEKAGLGWVGKHSNLLHRQGSWFFLGEIYIDLPLPVDTAIEPHCGTCRACMDICPTQAIVEPYVVDARLCISYLTIELQGPIPEELRPLIGNRIYGCDDCQLVCPWNRFTANTAENDFEPRHELDTTSLVELFAWDESRFLQRTEGSAIRRLGHERWLRNIAVALGNATSKPAIIEALQERCNHTSPLVREHVAWALKRHGVTCPEQI